jgi:hypothetical protein
MVSITQQAQRVLVDYREQDRQHGTLSRMSARETGGIQIQQAPPLPQDTVISDADGPLLAIDARALQDSTEGTILHYRTAADLGDAPEGWVLLKTRNGHARSGLATSVTSAASSPRQSSVVRAVGAILHTLR